MTINCKGELIDLSTPRIMGILNVTPNSFYDGGKYKTDIDFLNQAEKMLKEGADFIDLGAYSTKPNAEFVSEEEEINRLVAVVALLVDRFPTIKLSIDTFRAEVAQHAIDAGASIVNDIAAGLLDERMLEVVGRLQVPYIMMHMRGNPQTMQSLTTYEDLIAEMRYYFSARLAQARAAKINDIILDPDLDLQKASSRIMS